MTPAAENTLWSTRVVYVEHEDLLVLLIHDQRKPMVCCCSTLLFHKPESLLCSTTCPAHRSLRSVSSLLLHTGRSSQLPETFLFTISSATVPGLRAPPSALMSPVLLCVLSLMFLACCLPYALFYTSTRSLLILSTLLPAPLRLLVGY
jgi:hypothetical protein